jgi:hypothetical protein
MAKESPAQQEKIGEVMQEFKRGDLKSSSGRKVRNPKQAIAIGLSEAGASRKQSPGEKRQAKARVEKDKR